MRKIALFLTAALVLAGCNNGGAPNGGGGQPVVGGGPAAAQVDLNQTAAPATVALPAGSAFALDQLVVSNVLGDVSVAADGTLVVQAFEEGPLFAQARTPAGDTLLMGWLGGGRDRLDARSTAEMLLYLYGGLFMAPPEGATAVLGEVSASPQADDVEAAVGAALASGATSLEQVLEQVRDVLGDAARTLTNPLKAEALTLIDPLDTRSGIRVDAEGFASVLITNYYRRRAYFWLERVGYTMKGTSGTIPDEAQLVSKELEPTQGYEGFFEIFTQLSTGLYTPVIEGPFSTPRTPEEAQSTLYRVTAVGLGAEIGDYGQLTDDQALQHAWTVTETLFIDLFLPYLTTFALPKNTNIEKAAADLRYAFADFKSLVRELVKEYPDITAKAAAGDIQGALGELAAVVAGDPRWNLLVLAAIESWLERFLPTKARQAFSQVALFMEEFTRKVVVWIDFVGVLADTATQAFHISKSSNADVWDVEITNGNVTLDPTNARLVKNAGQDFTVIVQDGSNDPNVAFVYKWKTGGQLGKISDPLGKFDYEFDSSSDFVRYSPQPGAVGTDFLEVEVFEIVNGTSERRSVGRARARIDVMDREPLLVKRKVSLQNGGTEDFEVRIDPPFDTPKEVFYRWSANPGFGTFDGPLGENTDVDKVSYSANSEGREGTDMLMVEAFVIEDGEPRSLGTSCSEIRVEVKKSIIHGALEFQTEFDGNGRHCTGAFCRVAIPDGAIQLNLRAYGGFDPGFYRYKVHMTATKLPDGMWKFGSRTLPQDDAYWGLSGGCGPESTVQHWIDSLDKRFNAFVWETEVIYGE